MEPASPHLAHFKTQLVACPMIAILRGLRPVEAPSIGQALWHAGFRIIEVPLNSPQALQSIALLRQLLPNAIIGAGTVLTAKEVQAVHKAGGQIILAPNMRTRVIRAALDLGLISLPGVMTPTEAFTALEAGAHGLKLFPAEIVSPAALKALRAILPPKTLLLPVGGIGLDNLAAYRNAGADGFGLGSSLYKPGKTLYDIKLDAIKFIAANAYFKALGD